MGILDSLKSVGRRLNESRYSHATVMVPIGRDPDTGEEITVPEEELIQKGQYNPAGMHGPSDGNILMPKQVRTGQSGFGQFLSQGLPRMATAGIEAATSPGDGSGGALAVLKGMNIGSQALQKRDMIAHQMQRQAQQDAGLAEDRQAKAEENRAQAAWYRHKAEMEDKPAAVKLPTSYEQILAAQYAAAATAEERAAIEAKMAKLHQGTPAKSPEEEWKERKRRATELGMKEGSPEYQHYMANGSIGAATRTPAETHPEARIRREKEADDMKLTGERRQSYILTGNLPQTRVGRTDPGEKPATKREFLGVENKKNEALLAAKKAAKKEIEGIWAGSIRDKQNPAAIAARQAKEDDVWKVLAQTNKEIQDAYEAGVAVLKGESPARRNPMAAPRPIVPVQIPPSLFGGQKKWKGTSEFGR